MNLCSDNHEEICHEGRNCPVCEIIKEKDAEIESLEQDVKAKDDEIGSLLDDLESETEKPEPQPSLAVRVGRWFDFSN